MQFKLKKFNSKFKTFYLIFLQHTDAYDLDSCILCLAIENIAELAQRKFHVVKFKVHKDKYLFAIFLFISSVSIA